MEPRREEGSIVVFHVQRKDIRKNYKKHTNCGETGIQWQE